MWAKHLASIATSTSTSEIVLISSFGIHLSFLSQRRDDEQPAWVLDRNLAFTEVDLSAIYSSDLSYLDKSGSPIRGGAGYGIANIYRTKEHVCKLAPNIL